VIARSVAVIEAGGVLRRVASQPPLTIRQVRSADREVCVLCLVGSAAGPLAGDEVSFELTVGPDAAAMILASGASIAQGIAGRAPSRLSSVVTVGERGRLTARPAALIVSAGSSVLVRIALVLAETATASWRELLVLGRAGEAGGSVVLHWSVHRSGRPVLVQTIELTEDASMGWPGMLGANRVVASALISGPGVVARTLVDSPTAVCQKVDEQTVLITVLDQDAVSAERRLSELIAATDGAATAGPS
jgi:urease accessory protein